MGKLEVAQKLAMALGRSTLNVTPLSAFVRHPLRPGKGRHVGER